MPRETVRRHMGRLVALGLFERAEDQTFVPTEELRGLRSSGRYACFVRELRDYCDLTSAQQLRQLSDIRRDPVRPQLVAATPKATQLRRREPIHKNRRRAAR